MHNTKLAAEINTLLQQAHEDCDELREAVAQQEQYETEMKQLTMSIKEAQEQLLGSPIQASSVEALKQQITEHNVCTRTGFVKTGLILAVMLFSLVSHCYRFIPLFTHRIWLHTLS